MLIVLVRWTRKDSIHVLLLLLIFKQRKIFGRLFFVSILSSYCKVEEKNLKNEAEVMKDIPGWEVGKSVYNSRKWVPRPQY